MNAQLQLFVGYVIVINGRFFSRIKNGRVQTAWSIAGAKIYTPIDRTGAIDDCAELLSRGKKAVLTEVNCGPAKALENAGQEMLQRRIDAQKIEHDRLLSEALDGGDTWIPF